MSFTTPNIKAGGSEKTGSVEVSAENHTISASQHCQLKELCTKTANTSLKIYIRIGIFHGKKIIFNLEALKYLRDDRSLYDCIKKFHLALRILLKTY